MKPEPIPTQSSIRYLKGIGPKRALALEKVGIKSLRDLLFYFPRRYEDRSQFCEIAKVIPEQTVSLRGEILSVHLKRIRRMQILELVLGDASGMIHAVWFNQPYLRKQFQEGQEIIIFGKVELYKKRLQMSSPEYEILDQEESVHTGRVTPIYPLTEGLFQRSLRQSMKEIVENHLVSEVQEYLPEVFRLEHGLMELNEAVTEMHFPTDMDTLDEARKRIVFDEFLIFEMVLFRKMERLKNKYEAHQFVNGQTALSQFKEVLPFTLTDDQEKVMADLILDLSKGYPMNRLVQGDVGSGKTLVAAFAMYLATQNQHQAALLVPTEILAEQHYLTLKKIMEELSISVQLLTSSTPNVKRERLVAELKQGKIQILVGTHAILQQDVTFKSLGLVVVDEQHKFGVHQRSQLLTQSVRPHQMVMTATPIPRTLAFTVYGNLSISSIRQLPKGRQPIKTFWITRKKQKEVLEYIKKRTKEGDQAYFIFPLIEETEKMDLLAAEKEFDKLRKGIMKDVPMGLVHGRMSKDERDQIMASFRAGEIHVLVATSVIEVGVDHPNATLMVIENGERFGLAQLHQMRGRIGRGSKASECFIFGEPTTDEGKKRLRIFSKTQDGFQIAEEDMRIRGFGDFLGTRQSGAPYFRVANPIEDEDLLRQSREIAYQLIENHALEEEEAWFPLRTFLEHIEVYY